MRVRQPTEFGEGRVPVQGGLPEKLPMPYGEFGALTADARLIADALAYAGLEFTVPFAEGIELLTATYEHQRFDVLFGVERDRDLLHTLLIAITRPRTD